MSRPLHSLARNEGIAQFRKDVEHGYPLYRPLNDVAGNCCKLANAEALSLQQLGLVEALGFKIELRDKTEPLPFPGRTSKTF